MASKGTLGSLTIYGIPVKTGGEIHTLHDTLPISCWISHRVIIVKSCKYCYGNKLILGTDLSAYHGHSRITLVLGLSGLPKRYNTALSGNWKLLVFKRWGVEAMSVSQG